jgi:hypothetical protein
MLTVSKQTKRPQEQMRITFLLLAIFLTGCATVPRDADIVLKRGPLPTEEQVAGLIGEAVKQALKDPDSPKQFRITSPARAIVWYRGLLQGGGYEEAWMYCIEFNAKNSYGGYTGVKTDRVALRMYEGGGPVMVLKTVNWPLVESYC